MLVSHLNRFFFKCVYIYKEKKNKCLDNLVKIREV